MIINSTDRIIQKAHSAVRKAGSRNPDQIAQALGIIILERNLGGTKGFYTIKKRSRFVVLNDQLESGMRDIVLLHEIGHDQLHRSEAQHVGAIDLFQTETGHMEDEANLFAAEISLPDEDILKLIYQERNTNEIAGIMESNVNLVSLKVKDLVRRGHILKVPRYDRRFLE